MKFPEAAAVLGRRAQASRRRRRILLLAVATAVAAGVLITGTTDPAPVAATYAGAQAASKANIVLILTDDMRRDDLATMPNVRRLLVDNGRRYTRAWATHPLCCPARAEILTGQYGQNSGVQHNSGPWGGWASLRNEDQTIGAWLQAAGYRTQFIGKYLNGYYAGSDRPPRPAGWSRWDAQARPTFGYRRGGFWDGSTFEHTYYTRPVGRRVLRFIDRSHTLGSPFFTFISFIAPHGRDGRQPLYQRRYADLFATWRVPVLDSPSFNEADVSDLPKNLQRRGLGPYQVDREVRWWRARVRSLRSVDAAVGRIVHRLHQTGELDNSYIVVTSDNGHMLGEHRFHGKDLLFDEAMAVPLVVRGPGIRPGSRRRQPVGLIDLAPTILGWAGSTPSRVLDGLRLQRLTTSGGSLRDTMLIQTGNTVQDATPGWKYRGVKSHRYHYFTEAGNPNIGVLFDQRADPHQMTNLFDKPRYAKIRAELQRRTDILSSCSGPDCAQVFGPLPVPLP